MRADSLASTEEVCQLSKGPQEEASLSNRYVRGTLSLQPQVEWTPRCPDLKEGQIALQWLECRLVFHLKHEGMSESPEETLEKALGPRLIWTGDLTSL